MILEQGFLEARSSAFLLAVLHFHSEHKWLYGSPSHQHELEAQLFSPTHQKYRKPFSEQHQ